MRYIIYGAGAIGGVVGAKLFLNGNEVILIARGAHLESMQTDGLRVKQPYETLTVRMPAVAHPSEIEFRNDDVVVLTMKSQDTVAALDDLRLAGGEDLAVVCCQNGVENERMALRRFARVYTMLVVLPATFLELGVVEATTWPNSGVLDVGRYPEGVDDLARAIASDWDAAGLRCVARADIMRWKYAKLHGNMQNAVQAVCGPEGHLRDIVTQIRAEAKACFVAAGIDPVPSEEYSERMQAMRGTDGRGGPRPAGQGSSTWQSLVRGTGSSEVDYLNGEIVLLGRLYGVPTPANEVFQRYAERMARRHEAPGSVSVEEMREQIARREAELAAATV